MMVRLDRCLKWGKKRSTCEWTIKERIPEPNCISCVIKRHASSWIEEDACLTREDNLEEDRALQMEPD
ncbi:hypothetical protein CEXT_583161 [Caerostris extrusa]|uniref:Uncharacterized protein n=1 Tax=Caerostris extrusa TaxID=172846 RepID=A0AAV4NI20_CAEEX|nr:hypothetical protein CEXT_583161 [Caerostris extrusa]